MDYATIKGTYEAVKYARSALELAINAKANDKAREQVSDAMSRLGEVQDGLFALREELSKLQDENHELKNNLRELADWDAKASEYSLTKTDGGAVVYSANTPIEHYVCPSCFSNQRLEPLQDRNVVSGHFECPACKAKYPVKESLAAGGTVAISKGGPWR
ncbi:Trm112 family protein [Salinisphaera orenii]|uniref:Trm112 family protein n=1 Tax=Salinisphaera orenii TaxID=856731 RepID=UPI000F4D0512|nr:Trm112 family protein [Salinisphaera orenii]